MADKKKDMQKVKDDWVETQKRTFCAWANTHLKKRDRNITDLVSGFQNGENLVALLETITEKKVPMNITKNAKGRIQMIQNNKIALDFCGKEGLKLGGMVGAEEIVDGNVKIILGLMWTMILRYQIARKPKKKKQPPQQEEAAHVATPQQQDSNPTPAPLVAAPTPVAVKKPEPKEEVGDAQRELLEWARNQLKGYPVSVTDFTDSWSSGAPLCALVHSLKKGALDFDEEMKKGLDPLSLNKLAIEAAERELDVPKIIDPEDVTMKPEKLSMMTYISYFRDYYMDHEEELAPVEIKPQFSPQLSTVSKTPKDVKCGDAVSFSIQARDLDSNPIADAVTKDKFDVSIDGPEPLTANVTEDANGEFKVAFTPRQPGKYKVSVTSEGNNLLNSPFTVDAKGEFDPSHSKVESDSLTSSKPIIIGEPQTIKVISSDKFGNPFNEGGEKLNVSITNKSGKDISPKCEVAVNDNKDGTYHIQFTPSEIGKNAISISNSKGTSIGEKVEFQVNSETVPGKCAASGEGFEQPSDKLLKVEDPVVFTIVAKGPSGEQVNHGGDDFQVSIVAPSGETLEIPVNDNGDGTHTVEYAVMEPGMHKISVSLDGKEIAGSPSHVEFVAPVDSSQSEATGAGVLPNTVFAGEEVKFTVQAKDKDGKDLNYGGDQFDVQIIQVDQKNKPLEDLKLEDNDDGTYTVTYTPNKPGHHSIRVQLNGKNIKNSPFTIFPELVPYAKNCKVSAKPFKSGETVRFDVRLHDKFGTYIPKGGHKVAALLEDENGIALPMQVIDYNDGVYGAVYSPGVAPGNYSISVKVGEDGYLDSVPVSLVPEVSAKNCAASGPGLIGSDLVSARGVPAIFTIHARDIYNNPVYPRFNSKYIEPMRVLLERMAEFDEKPRDSVKKPKKKKNKEDVAQSAAQAETLGKKPDFDRYYYQVPEVLSDKDVSFVNPLYEPFDQEAFKEAQKVVPFTVQIVNADAAAASSNSSSDTSSHIEPILFYAGDDKYVCVYRPREVGDHHVNISVNGEAIRNSPIIVPATNGIDPDNIELTGPGLTRAYPDVSTFFTIKPRDKRGKAVKTGGSEFKVEIKDPNGKNFSNVILIDDVGNGDYTVSYIPKIPGNHEVSVKYKGKLIKVFNVDVAPASEAPNVNNCEVINFKPRANSKEPFQFQVKMRDDNGKEIKKGGDNVQVFVIGPVKTRPEQLVPNPIPNYPEDLPLVHWKKMAEAGEEEAANNNAKVFGVSQKAVEFKNPPAKDEFGNYLSIPHNGLVPAEESNMYPVTAYPGIESPQQLVPSVEDYASGVYNASFTPKEPGTYLVNVLVNNEPLPSAPYEVKVFSRFNPRGIRVSNYTFTIRTPVSTMKESDFSVNMQVPTGEHSVIPSIRKADQDKFYVVYDVPKEDIKPGMYKIQAKYKDREITGSPFNQTFETKILKK